MSPFDRPASHYMRSPVHCIGPEANARDALEMLVRSNLSGLLVCGDPRAAAPIAGMITRTDFLQAERAVAPRDARTVMDLMSLDVVSVGSDATLRDVARRMDTLHVHRVIVRDDGRALGVIGPHEILRAIVDARLPQPLSEIASRPVLAVTPTDTLAFTLQLLAETNVSGVMVVEDDWPIGVFTQMEALATYDLAEDTTIDGHFGAAIACLPRSTPLHRAATQAVSLRVQRVLSMKGHEVDGIVSGTDFARAVVQSD